MCPLPYRKIIVFQVLPRTDSEVDRSAEKGVIYLILDISTIENLSIVVGTGIGLTFF